MNVIVLLKNLKRPVKVHLGPVRIGMLAVAGLLLPASLAGYLGFTWGNDYAHEHAIPSEWMSEVERQRGEVESARHIAQENLNALASRMGAMQAQVIRLDALGRRLVDLAGLEQGEFDFENPPAQGGPEESTPLASPPEIPDFLRSLDGLSRQIDDRQQQLSVLESWFLNRNLRTETFPAGRPVEKGWVSSYFGLRSDPFTGRRAHHHGIDIAGRKGSPVIAVGAGVVIWSGERSGYGRMVEVNHGNGYVTRYAHNQENTVQVGDTVAKGQTIALMGSSGRSTGPHVHFEVLRNNRVVDPMKYLRAAR